MAAITSAIGHADLTVGAARNRSVAQNSAGISAATSGWGQLVHMTMNPEPANARPPTTEAPWPAPRPRQNRNVKPMAAAIWTSLMAAGANQVGNTTYMSSNG